jgi:hypothetical protein
MPSEPQPVLPPAAGLGLRVALDMGAVRGFTANQSCLLRVRIDADLQTIRGVTIRARLSTQALPELTTAQLLPGAHALMQATFVPDIAGQHILDAAIEAIEDATGATLHATLEPIPLQVLDSAPAVQHIHIDQRSARVVDNSRSTFGVRNEGGVIEGTFAPWPVRVFQRAPLQATTPVAPAPNPLPPRHQPQPVSFAVTTALGRYEAHRTLGHGDLATLFAARAMHLQPSDVVLKIADDRADNDLMLNESRVLERLHAVDAPARRHLPRLLDGFRTDDGRVGHALEHLEGIDLFEVRRRLPDGLPPRHLVWVLRRSLGILAFAHAQGVLHGNLDPSHILIRPSDHMVWLVDWCWSVVEPARTGDRFKALNEDMSPPEVRERKPPLPASDLYALGRVMFVLAGGDPRTRTLPPMDERLERFLRFMVVESPRGRPQDAYELYLELDRVRERIWGPHVFVPLDI